MADITSNLELLAEYEGNLNDSSGNSRNGTGFGSPTYGTGQVGTQCVDLELGSSQYVSHGNNVGIDNASACTISCWCQLESMPAQTLGIFGKDNGGSSRIGASVNGSGGTITVSNSNGGTHFGTSGAVIVAGQWIHVTMVFDGTLTGNANRMKLYVNGVQQTLSFTGTIPSTFPNNTTTPFFVGRQTTSGTGYWDGLIDQVRVYSRALSQADVTALARETNRNVIWHDNASLYKSKYQWVEQGNSLRTINANAEVKLGFTGTSLSMLLITGASADGSLACEVDGSGTWTRFDLTTTQREQSLASGLSSGSHTARIKYITYGQAGANRYNTTDSFAFHGIVLDAAASVSAPTIQPFKAIFYGDSHSEGVGITGNSGRATRDSRQAFPQIISDAISAECSTVGFGGIGYNVASVASVPAAKNSWSEYFSGATRLTAGAYTEGEPTYIFLHLGHNDTPGTVQSSVEETITELRAAAPDAIIFVCLPPNLNCESAITAAELAVGDANTHLIDHNENVLATPAYLSADGTHLTVAGSEHYADLILALIDPFLLDPPATGGSNYTTPVQGPYFSPGFSPLNPIISIAGG